MTRWRLPTSDKRHYDNIEKLIKVSNGGDILANLKHRRQKSLCQEPFDLISITRILKDL